MNHIFTKIITINIQMVWVKNCIMHLIPPNFVFLVLSCWISYLHFSNIYSFMSFPFFVLRKIRRHFQWVECPLNIYIYIGMNYFLNVFPLAHRNHHGVWIKSRASPGKKEVHWQLGFTNKLVNGNGIAGKKKMLFWGCFCWHNLPIRLD